MLILTLPSREGVTVPFFGLNLLTRNSNIHLFMNMLHVYERYRHNIIQDIYIYISIYDGRATKRQFVLHNIVQVETPDVHVWLCGRCFCQEFTTCTIRSTVTPTRRSILASVKEYCAVSAVMKRWLAEEASVSALLWYSLRMQDTFHADDCVK